MELFGPQIMEVLQQYLWPMVRVSAFFLTAPFFGLAAVNLRVKIGLGMVFTWLILPSISVPDIDPFIFLCTFARTGGFSRRFYGSFPSDSRRSSSWSRTAHRGSMGLAWPI